MLRFGRVHYFWLQHHIGQPNENNLTPIFAQTVDSCTVNLKFVTTQS